MNKPVKIRVSAAAGGHTFEAAPSKATLFQGAKPLPGTKPRLWETRQPGECAAAVRQETIAGWPRTYSCCAPTGAAATPYCPDHEDALWQEPKTTKKELMRSLRKIA